MLKNLYLVEISSLNPYYNLALEEYLFDTLPLGSCLLYLWQNEKTVVIGRNQNASNECNLEALDKDGAYLARRLSGGGAVYHDVGNLNFTFIADNDYYDIPKQTKVILKAMQSLGLNAVVNGRNDLTIDDKKFSGHAYYKGKKTSYHHGTIMLEVDSEKLAKYLNVPLIKLQDKHVKSVKSRVINLKQLKPDITINEVKTKLIEAFSELYELDVKRYDNIDEKVVKKLEQKYCSKEWLLGIEKQYQRTCEHKFNWGIVRIDYNINSEKIIEDVAVYSDGLEAIFLSDVPELLKNIKLDKTVYQETVKKIDEDNKEIFNDIFNLLCTSEGVTL